MCSGYAGRDHGHIKLEKLFNKHLVTNNEEAVKMYSQTCPEIAEEENQKCHCGTKSTNMEHADVLQMPSTTVSKKPDKLRSKLRALAKHACDMHTRGRARD